MNEHEIERMVVRLMGDGSDYKKMLETAIKETAVAMKKIQQQGEAIKRQGVLMQQAGQLTSAAIKPLERFRTEVTSLSRHLQAGRIDQETFNFHVRNARSAFDAANTGVTQFSTTLMKTGMTVSLVGASMTAIFGGLGTMAVMSAGRFEQTLISFETMLGSAQAAQDVLKDLTDFAAFTPYEMPQIEVAARGLIMFGERGPEMMETLEIIGNAAAATSSDFGMLALIFNQVRGVGRLLTQDFRQLSTRGVMSLQDIANHFKVSQAAAQEMLSEGKVSFEDLRDILRGLSAEGGRFHNMMERQSKSMIGMWSTLQDNIGLTTRAIGEYMLPAAKAFVGWMIKLTDSARASSPQIKLVVAVLTGLGFALGTISTTIGGAIMAISRISMALNALTVSANLSSGAAVTLKVAMVGLQVAAAGLAVGGILLLGKALYDQLPWWRATREEAEKFQAATTKLTQEGNKVTSDILGKASRLQPQDKAAFLNAELEESIRLFRESSAEASDWDKTVAEFTTQTGKPLLFTQEAERAREEAAMYKERAESISKLINEMNTATEDPMSEINQAGKEFVDQINQQIRAVGESAEMARLSELRLKGLNVEVYNAGVAATLHKERLQAQNAELEKQRALAEQTKKRLVEHSEALIKGLEEQIATLGMSGREVQIWRLEQDKASEATLKMARALDAELTAMEEHNKLMEEGRRVMQQYLSPQEKFLQTYKDLAQLFSMGAIDPGTFERAAKEAARELEEATRDRTVNIDIQVAGLDAVAAGTREADELARKQEEIWRLAQGGNVASGEAVARELIEDDASRREAAAFAAAEAERGIRSMDMIHRGVNAPPGMMEDPNNDTDIPRFIPYDPALVPTPAMPHREAERSVDGSEVIKTLLERIAAATESQLDKPGINLNPLGIT